MAVKRWVIGCLILVVGTVATVGLAFLVVSLSMTGGGGDGLSLSPLGRKVGLVEVVGAIEDPDPVVEQLERMRRDTSIRAVVVRLDSPGGGVAASQEIYEAVRKIHEEGKPVVASMGGVAASGAFYVACAADSIMANPGTLTGSIGVIMSFPNTEELFRKVGIKLEVVKTGKFKDVGSMWRPMTSEEQKLLEPFYLKALGIQKVQNENPEWVSWNTANQSYQDYLNQVANAKTASANVVPGTGEGTWVPRYYGGESGMDQMEMVWMPSSAPTVQGTTAQIAPVSAPGKEPERYSYAYEEIPKTAETKTAADLLAEKQLLLQGYIYNPDGTLRQASEEEMISGMTPSEREAYDIQKLTNERTKKALAGTLEIPAVVEESLADQQRIQEEQLARMYGPNWALSTPGQNLRKKQESQRTSVRSGVAQGQLDSSGALSTINQNIINALSNQTSGLYNQTAGANFQNYSQMMGYPARSAGLIGVYGNLANQQEQERVNQYTAAMQAAANRNTVLGQLLGLGGTLGAAALLG